LKRGGLLVASVANLKCTSAPTFDDDLAVRQTQFDLANATARGIDFSAISVARCAGSGALWHLPGPPYLLAETKLATAKEEIMLN
jgi:hypothetical protein